MLRGIHVHVLMRTGGADRLLVLIHGPLRLSHAQVEHLVRDARPLQEHGTGFRVHDSIVSLVRARSGDTEPICRAQFVRLDIGVPTGEALFVGNLPIGRFKSAAQVHPCHVFRQRERADRGPLGEARLRDARHLIKLVEHDVRAPADDR